MRGNSDDAKKASDELRRKIHTDTKAIEGDFDHFGATAGKASAALASFAGNIASQAVTALASTLKDTAAAVLNFSSKMEQTKIGFSSLLGNAEKAEKLLSQIKKLALDSPFEFADLAPLAQRLLGANVELEKIIPLLTDIGNVVSATGEASRERLEGITVALTQVISKQKLSAEEAEQFAERGVNAYDLIAKATGKTQTEIRALGEKGALSADLLVKSLQKISREKFGDAAAKQSKTFAGAMSSIKDILMQTAATAFQPLFNQIRDLAVRFSSEIQSKQGDYKAIGNLIAKYIGEGLGLGLSIVAEQIAKQFGARLKELFTAKSIIDPITQAFVDGFWAGVIKAFGGSEEKIRQFRKTMKYAYSFGTRTKEESDAEFERENPRKSSIADLRKYDDTNTKDNSAFLTVDPKVDAEKERKKAEDLAKRDLAAAIQMYQNTAAQIQKVFDDAFNLAKENLEKTGDTEAFKNKIAEIREEYLREIGKTNAGLINLENLQAEREEKTANERSLLQQQQQIRSSEWLKKHADAQAESEKAITEAIRKETEKREKAVEDSIRNEIRLREKSTETVLKQLELARSKGLITEDEFIKKRQLLYVADEEAEKLGFQGLLEFKKSKLEELLTKVKGNAEKEKAIKQEILETDEEIKGTQADQRKEVHERLKDLEKERELRHEILTLIASASAVEEKRQSASSERHGNASPVGGSHELSHANAADSEEAQSGIWDAIFNGLGTSVDKASESVDYLNQLGQMLSQTFSQVSQAVGAAVRSFVLFGSAGGSFRKFAAEVVASIAQMAVVQSIFELAQGFAMSALAWFTGNPKFAKSAADHYIAAGVFAGIAGIAAIAGRGIAGNAFKQETQGAFGSAGSQSSSGGTRSTPENDSAQVISLGRNAPQGAGGDASERFSFKHDHNFKLKIEFEDFKTRVVEAVVESLRKPGDLRDEMEEAFG